MFVGLHKSVPHNRTSFVHIDHNQALKKATLERPGIVRDSRGLPKATLSRCLALVLGMADGLPW